MTSLKKRLIAVLVSVLIVSFLVFLVTGYTALYWGWLRGNLQAALPYLPWARNSGALAIVCAVGILWVLFSPGAFPVSPKLRLWLSLLATLTIAFFSEFRNEGKFYFRRFVHFFGPGTWIHDGLNRAVSSLGDFFYRLEYSHWNDFLMGPAIVSVFFSLVFIKIYGTFRDQQPISVSGSAQSPSLDPDSVLRFARTLMYVGLFWFFIQAWAEKAGYVRNHYSNDEIDLPFEFAGTIVGFWMTRVLTKPLAEHTERFRSTLLIDFVSAGVVGLLYTLVVSPLTEAVASTIAHGLQPTIPASLNFHEYTPFQQHMRPLELLLVTGAMWWGLNSSARREEMIPLGRPLGETEPFSKWEMLVALARPTAAIIAYLLFTATMLVVIEPEGLGWILGTAGAALVFGTVSLLLVKRFGRRGLTTVFGRNAE